MRHYRQKILVTGATGFIGQRLLKELLLDHNLKDILCLINNPSSQLEQDALIWITSKKIAVVYLDLSNISIKHAFQFHPEIVYHLAAVTDTSKSSYDANDVGIQFLFSYIDVHTHTPSVIYTSSTAIYCGRLNCTRALDEKSEPCPSNAYGKSKLEGERILSELEKKGLISLTIIRLPTVYGEAPRINSLFDFSTKLIRKKSFLSRVNWPGLTGLTHVDDVAYVLAHLPKQTQHNSYILCTENISLQSIFKSLYSRLGIRYVSIDLPMFLWKCISTSRPIVYSLESFIPASLYNLLWRATLVVDNVIYCRSSSLFTFFPKRRWKFFLDVGNQVLYN